MSQIFDYNKLCKDISCVDSKIRFVGVINDKGRLVAGGMKDGVEPLESEKDDEMLFMELALRVRMRREFDKQLGNVKFAMSLREKALAMSFPIGFDSLYVVAESDADYKEVPDRILKTMQEFGIK